MTAHRCCPECGAELTADGGKFCGCVGPFTAEHVDPMHIRPYVDLPEPADEETRAPDLEPFARCGQGETAELPVLRPYEGEGPGGAGGPVARAASAGSDAYAASAPSAPSAAHAAYDYDGYDGYGDDEGHPGGASARPVPSVARVAGHRRKKGAAAYGGNEATARRRRPAKAAFAAAGVVAALGAGLLTAQTLTDDGSGDDRSLSTDDSALPDIPSGDPTEEPSRTDEHKREKKPSAKPTSRTGSVSPRADRGGDEHTGQAPAPPRTSASSAPGESGGTDGRDYDHDWGWGGGNPDQERPRPPQDSTEPDEETLRAGDTGPEVAELQRRLKQVGALDESAPEDGVYSAQVQQAVAQYQARNGIRGDRYGEYGSYTRRALESQTSD